MSISGLLTDRQRHVRHGDLHPASRLPLWDVADDTVVTTQGCYARVLRVQGLESEACTHAELEKAAQSLYADARKELDDHTFLQFVLTSHGRYSDVWERYDRNTPSDPILANQRRRRREFLQRCNLRRFELYAAVGVARVATTRDFGRVSAKLHQRRLSETLALQQKLQGMLAAAQIRSTPATREEILALYANAINGETNERLSWQRDKSVLGEVDIDTHDPQLAPLSLREFLMREPLRWDRDWVQIGDTYHKVLTLQCLPTPETRFTLMEAFLDLDVDFRLSVEVLMPPQQRFRRVSELRRRVSHSLADGRNIEDHGKRIVADEADELDKTIAETGQKFVLVSMRLVLSGCSVTQLERSTREVRRVLKDKGLVFFEENLAHDTEIFKTLPGLGFTSDRYKLCLSNNAVDLLPLFVPPTGDRNPVLLLQTSNNTMFAYDPFESVRKNWNAVVLGAAGSGKSVFMNMLITSALLGGHKNSRVLVVDFAGEKVSSYLMVAKLFGGRFIPFVADGDYAVNPFPPPTLALNPDGATRAPVLNFLTVLTDILLANTGTDKDSELFRGIVQRAIMDVYAGRTGDDAPVYGDLLDTLNDYQRSPRPNMEPSRVAVLIDLLSAFLRSPSARLFNRRTTLTLDNPFTVFDLAGIDSMPKNVAEAVTFLVCYWARDVSFREHSGVFNTIIFDEAAQHLRQPRMRELFDEGHATSRKHSTSLWFVTQEYEALVRSELMGLILNSSTLVLLDHADAEKARERIVQDWKLNPREAHLFGSLTTKKGRYSQFLLRTHVHDPQDDQRRMTCRLTLRLSPFDYQLSTSDGADRKKQQEFLAAHPGLPLHVALEKLAEHTTNAKRQGGAS